MIQTTSIRQYTPTSYLADYSMEDVNLAEMLIDSYIPTYRSNNMYAKSIVRDSIVEVDFVDSKIVLPDSQAKNYYQYANVEILSGSLAGELLSVISSEDNLLTVNTLSLPNETGVTVKISQIGKFPFFCDYKQTIKTIPNTIRQAAILQLKYLAENKETMNSILLKSETESTSSYSYTLGGMGDEESILLSPVVKKLIDSLGLYQIV